MRFGLDMEQHSQSFVLAPDLNTVPALEPYSLQESYDNNSMVYELPHYHNHLGPDMSALPSHYLPYEPSQLPQSHLLAHGAALEVTSTVHESHGYKRKSGEVTITGDSQYLAPCSYPETEPFSFPHYGTTYLQPMDQRSVRSRVGEVTMDPSYSHHYAAHPFQPPDSMIWYDQHCNDNQSDGTSSLWPQQPYMHGNGSIDSGNVGFPRYHEPSSSGNDTPYGYPGPNYFSHHPAPQPMTIHDASYSHVGPVQITGFRINQQHPRDDFSPAATLRHHGLSHLRAIPADEVADYEEGDFSDDDDVDDHEDMRLDIEDMSYEELLALSDDIGTVKTGLSEEAIKDLLKRRTSISTRRINLEEAPSTDLESDSCIICQENYKNQEKIVTLNCKHEYHAECLEQWLVIKNVCPICKSEALVMDMNKEP